jgi:polysaccharide pyruvyl transferase WcaK-like protein
MRIAFWGNFGALNFGNECTLAAAVGNMRARLPQAELIVICRDPADAASRHGIAALSMSRPSDPAGGRRASKPVRALRLLGREAAAWMRALRHASSIDALLITGSGILSDEDEGLLGLPYELFKWSLVTRLCGGKLFYVSVGAESISQPLSRALLKAALWLANYRCYRDTHSAQRLQRIGFNTDNDVVRPDLAFSLPQLAAASAVGPATEPLRHPSARFAIGLFNYRGRGQANDADAVAYRRYLDQICSLVASLLAGGHHVRIVIGDFAFDEAVRVDVRSELERRGLNLDNSSFADEPAASFEQLLDQLATVDFVVASRYHNVLLGLALGKPVVSLSYEGKHEALMCTMGFSDYCQSINDLDLQRLIGQIEQLKRNADALRAVIVERVAANRVSLKEQYDLIVSRIGADAGEGHGQ